METVRRGAATASITVLDGLAHAELRGVVSGAHAGRLGSQIANMAADLGAAGLLYRMDCAVMACSLDELMNVGEFSLAAESMPAAYVVAECDYPMLRELARRVATAGRIRRAFTDLEAALAWLLPEIEIWRHPSAPRISRSHP
jgi:hypothetical protein